MSKGLYENETFLKTSINGEFDFIKRPNTKSSKIACLSKTHFFANYTDDHWSMYTVNIICMVVWVEKAE